MSDSIGLAPFDNPNHDIALRSDDNVDFHHFKLILSLVSPIFGDMFTLPQNSSELAIPVVPVTEHSAILYPLLMLSYPSAGADPIFSSIDDARAVLEAAKKYEMGAILYRIGDLITAQFLSEDPLSVYSVSCLTGYQHHAQRAATRSLEIENLGQPSSEFTGMEAISAFDYHRLLQYHYECGIAAQAVGESLIWLPSTQNIQGLQMWNCAACCTNFAEDKTQIAKCGWLTVTPWFKEYLNVSGEELFARPCKRTLLESESYNHALTTVRDCSSCQIAAPYDLDTFRTLYITEVQNAIAKVDLAF
ncbi:hypothetical protein BDR04DRAFT_1091267 [Suillus decipiens]|nr:hypothetical protein BDR04DRAFT_1091267 [Suillus decipiens]